VFISATLLPWVAVGSSRTTLFVDVGLMGAGLGFALFALLLAVQHAVLRTELGVATSLNQFARTIGGAAGVALMGAMLTAGLGGTARFTPAALEDAGLAGLSPELRRQVIASLQRAFATGAVSAGIALVVSFWVPPFTMPLQRAGEEAMLGSEMTALEAQAEPVSID
jgi:hypothetical protein